jgi:glycosyltransferase involved in cell wall biosynthesis
MIKIAFVIDTIESPTAGTEKQLLMLIKNLSNSRFKPYLCVLRPSEWLKNNFHSCDLIDVGVNSFADPRSYLNILKFVRFLKKSHIDIVQTHFVEGNKVGVIAAKLAGVKAIISTRRNQGYWHNRLELYFLRLLNLWVTCFLANSENTRQWTARVEGVDPQCIEVIHNSLETDLFYQATEKQRAVFRGELGFPSDAIVIGIVANLRPVKAIDVFIAAAKLVADREPLARFVIIGEGSERIALESLCAEAGIKQKIRFLGRRTDIPALTSCMDIGVLSSNSESFSNAIVEYMAAGMAVVCTDVGGAREAVEDGVNGYVVPPGDLAQMAEKLLAVIQQKSAVAMGHKGREKAMLLFAQARIFEHYQQLYEEVA